ncbi:MAG: hypothetical protein GC200_12080 [Tepidisphaera sp.]|nr:hypothetical protein [Tepidisphaera sp.]
MDSNDLAARHGRFGDWLGEELEYLLEELEAGMQREVRPDGWSAFEGGIPALAVPGLSLARLFVTQGDYPHLARDAFPLIGTLASALLDNSLVRSDSSDFEDEAWTAYRPVILALEAFEQAAVNMAANEPQQAE